MKNKFYFLLTICWLMLIGQVVAAQENQDKRMIRFMSYNIRNGLGMDKVRNCTRTANVINKIKPDVVAVQEIDSVTERSKRKDVLLELAQLTGMHHVYAPAITYQGGKYGIGMLSRERPIRYYNIPLPGREEQRTLLVVEFKDYVYCNMHLSLTPEDQLLSLPIIQQEIASINKPVFIAGDFNTEPDQPFIQEFKKHFTIYSDCRKKTYPADQPDVTIDYIALSQKDTASFACLSKYVVDEPEASDHRPIVVDVIRKQPQQKIFAMKPYLMNPVGNGITVLWQTTVPAYSWVEYGTDKNNLKKARTIVDGQVICNDIQNKVRLNNLEPGKKYYYRICSQEILLYEAYRKVFGEKAVSDFYSFTLPEDKQSNFTAIIFNDLHKHSETLQALYRQVNQIDYDFVIFNGDCVDDPANHEQATRFIKELNETVDAADKPVFYIRGNHEIRNAYSIGLRNLYDYVGNKTYCAFNWGDTRFVMLDCGEDKPDTHWVYYGLNDFSDLRKAQVGFLKNELSSKPFKKATKRVLIHHIPLYGLGSDYNPCLEAWGGLLKNAPFAVSINAHTHKYAYHPAGSEGNTFPVVIGGGYKMKEATVMVLEKKDKNLTLKVLNTTGEQLLNLNL